MRWRRSAALAALCLLVAAAPARGQDAARSAAPPDPKATTVPAATTDPGPPADDPAAPATPGTDPSSGVIDGGGATGDPLAANGLGGALCRSDRLSGGLSAAARANCQTAGISAARAPVTHYGFDIHIDTGAVGVSNRTFPAAVQTLLLTPLWTLLLWAVHAVLAGLEWSYALELLDATTVGNLADALRSAHQLFTQPWLPVVLAIAGVALVYQGVLRRRVADTAGAAAAMAAMMIAALAAIADPAGTVGEANALVQQASLGTVAAVGGQDPARADASFADALGGIFTTVIEAPWCYLEFGDVEWCRDPARLDGRLTAAARRLADPDRQGLRCGPPACPDGDERDRSASLLARARTNGDVFLAFPANGDERNSVNDTDSLFRVLCRADSDDQCTGATAAQARWRTEAGTWSRAGGLALITVGVLGMVALLGFLALRLLGAAIIAMLCLLLAPLAVLAPALGEAGRTAFRSWGLRLLGALVSKLLYSALLGVVLLALHLLEGMGTLGWWTQWLLIAAFWWIVFAHRHRVFEVATLSHARTGAQAMSTTSRVITAHRLATIGADAALPARRLAERTRHTTRGAAREGRRRLAAQREDHRRQRAQGVAERAHGLRDAQTARVGEHAAAAARQDAQRVPHAEAQIDRLEARRARIGREISKARAAGDFKRVARLRDRDRRLVETIGGLRNGGDVRAERESGARGVPRADGDHHAWLDHQANLRRGVPPGPRADPAAYRDYPRLAALVGMQPKDYRALAPHAQRQMRLAIDRDLRARVEANRALEATGHGVSARGERPVPPAPKPRMPHAPTERDLTAARRRRQFGHLSDGPSRHRHRRLDDGPGA